MNLLSLIGDIFKPAAELIDDLHTSEEERGKLNLALREMQLNAALRFMDYEKQMLESKTEIIVAEAKGGSWMQRNWRPMTMLAFGICAVGDSFGVLPTPLADEMWVLMQIGLGGYVAGRSLEKIAPSVAEAIKK